MQNVTVINDFQWNFLNIFQRFLKNFISKYPLCIIILLNIISISSISFFWPEISLTDDRRKFSKRWPISADIDTFKHIFRVYGTDRKFLHLILYIHCGLEYFGLKNFHKTCILHHPSFHFFLIFKALIRIVCFLKESFLGRSQISGFSTGTFLASIPCFFRRIPSVKLVI